MKPRSPGQVLIGVAVDAKLLAEIDARRGTMNRSAFVRESLAKYLQIDLTLAAAPDRTGKGGKSRKPIAAVPGTGKPSLPPSKKTASAS
jgi:hypothetical protein